MNFQPFLECIALQRNFSPTTVRAYTNDLSIFSRFMDARGKSTVEEMDRALIVGFIDDMKQSSSGRLGKTGLSDATISRRLAAVSGFLDYVRATSLPNLRNPVRELKRKNRKNKGCRAVDEAILDQLTLGITILRDRVLIAMYLSTGLRLSELQQLNRDSITFDLRINERGAENFSGSGDVVGKGSKLRRFYVDQGTLPLYAEYLATRTDDNPALFLSERQTRLSARAIQYTLAAWCRKLNLPHIHPHQLRHVYACRIANAGIDPMQLRDLMGHSSFTTTLGYFKIREEKIAQGYFAAMEVYRLPAR